MRQFIESLQYFFKITLLIKKYSSFLNFITGFVYLNPSPKYLLLLYIKLLLEILVKCCPNATLDLEAQA